MRGPDGLARTRPRGFGCEAGGPEQGAEAAGVGEAGGLVDHAERDAAGAVLVVEGRHGVDVVAELAADRVQKHGGRVRFRAAIAARLDPDGPEHAAGAVRVDQGSGAPAAGEQPVVGALQKGRDRELGGTEEAGPVTGLPWSSARQRPCVAVSEASLRFVP
ncbi:hypothetical protein ACFWNT_40280 [Streptomyces sp. NPDC058409]|uniref:hypothetical protein n=1 Tax=Streptomyces sp. NPDC058409 TaxID=3346484 RepID=UPI00364D2467